MHVYWAHGYIRGEVLTHLPLEVAKSVKREPDYDRLSFCSHLLSHYELQDSL